MTQRRVVVVAWMAAMMAACGGGKGSGAAEPSAGNIPDEVPLVSAVGTDNGPAATRPIDAQGGSVSAAGITVSVPPGALTSGNLTVQPIADTLNGTGQAVAISSNTPWTRYLTVSFPLEASDNLAAMGVAVQQADGSWRLLAPVKIDPLTGTVSAGLPPDTEAAKPKATAQAMRQAAAGPVVKRVAKAWVFRLEPHAPKMVRANAIQHFEPWAREFENPDPACKSPPPDPSPLPGMDDLAPLTFEPECWTRVSEPRRLLNQKEGYAREWTVNERVGGTAATGTIVPTGAFGADYRAPDLIGQGTPYRIKFKSERVPDPSGKEVAIGFGTVQVFKDGLPASYNGTVALEGSDPAGNRFEATGSMLFGLEQKRGVDEGPLAPGQVTTSLINYPALSGQLSVKVTLAGCEPVTVTQVATGFISQLIEDSQDLGAANSYLLQVESDHIDIARTNCAGHEADVPVAFAFSSSSQCLGMLDQTINASGIIEGSSSTTCADGSVHIGSWKFTAQ